MLRWTLGLLWSFMWHSDDWVKWKSAGFSDQEHVTKRNGSRWNVSGVISAELQSCPHDNMSSAPCWCPLSSAWSVWPTRRSYSLCSKRSQPYPSAWLVWPSRRSYSLFSKRSQSSSRGGSVLLLNIINKIRALYNKQNKSVKFTYSEIKYLSSKQIVIPF